MVTVTRRVPSVDIRCVSAGNQAASSPSPVTAIGAGLSRDGKIWADSTIVRSRRKYGWGAVSTFIVTTMRVPCGIDVVNEHCGIALPPLEAAAAMVDARTANERAITPSAPREQTPGRVGPRFALACFAGVELPHPPRSTTTPIVAGGATQRCQPG